MYNKREGTFGQSASSNYDYNRHMIVEGSLQLDYQI